MLFTTKLKNLAIVFTVADLDRTERFYREVLEIPLQRLGDPEFQYLSCHLNEHTELMFFQGEATRGASPQVVFGLEHGGIDDVAEALAQRGATLVTPVTEAPGGWSVDFRDPDQHGLSLYQDGGLPRRR
ncbi:MAG: VOC family protein [Deltaproteobacteria bacterium]|jgi:glyoxylase I family protein|nr:VOC family protein [Deltaproteobacteria bacterium]